MEQVNPEYFLQGVRASELESPGEEMDLFKTVLKYR